jgi:hypothetical protein
MFFFGWAGFSPNTTRGEGLGTSRRVPKKLLKCGSRTLFLVILHGQFFIFSILFSNFVLNKHMRACAMTAQAMHNSKPMTALFLFEKKMKTRLQGAQ